ncbi:MAG: hypothetical protein ACP5QU_03865 [Anaerolineae bacterium]
MWKRPLLFWTLSLILLNAAACAPRPDPADSLRLAVAATLTAQPTVTPAPLPTPFSTATPFRLSGLFCEYRFCIGHPADVAFFDVSAQQNAAAPSSYSQGMLAAFNSNLFIQLMWQLAPDTSDPQFLLDLILDGRVDTRSGNLDIRLIGNMNVLYTAIQTRATPLLPNGGAAAWTCGERVFAWKAYTPDPQSPRALFESAIQRFVCED